MCAGRASPCFPPTPSSVSSPPTSARRALTRIGRADLALTALLRPDAPSPAAWLREGGDTLWEDWGEGASRNHIMFGDFAAWAVEGLAGLRPLEPGFRRFEVRPATNCGLTRIHAAVESPYGRIAVDWTAKGGLRVIAPYSVSLGGCAESSLFGERRR